MGVRLQGGIWIGWQRHSQSLPSRQGARYVPAVQIEVWQSIVFTRVGVVAFNKLEEICLSQQITTLE